MPSSCECPGPFSVDLVVLARRVRTRVIADRIRTHAWAASVFLLLLQSSCVSIEAAKIP